MKKRSKRYRQIKKKIEKKLYSIDEALDLIKKTSNTKFDASVEVHLRLGIDPTKTEQQVRGTVILPYPTGQKLKIAVFTEEKEKEIRAAGAEVVGGEDLVKKIKETGKCDFDIAIATPAMMRHVGQIGKILGTRGLMPNPKTETVTKDPIKTISELKSGKISFKTDPQGLIHQVIGKVSFDSQKLRENFKALISAIQNAKPKGVKGNYIKSVSLCSTMGPGIRVKV